MRLSNMVKPEGCMTDFAKTLLELFNLPVLRRFLIFDVIWINFQTIDVFLNLICMVLHKKEFKSQICYKEEKEPF